MTNQQGAQEAPKVRTADYEAGWKDGYKQGAWAAQQPAPSPAATPMSPINRLIAYSAATKLRELGFNWDEESKAWMNTAAPTAQADTKPTPVQDYPPLPECQGKIFDDGYWNQNKLGPKHCVMGGAKVWLESQVHEAIDADRAARAPADSVLAPAGGVDDAVDAIALARYKVVPSHESMFHRFAVVAGDGKQQLYLGREVECENMARKFAGAFLDGAFYQANIAPTPPAQAADSVQEDAEIDRIVPALEPVSEDFPAEWAVWKDRERIREELRAARKQGEKQ